MGIQKQLVIVAEPDRVLRRTSIPVLGEWLVEKDWIHAWYTLRKLYSVFSFVNKKMGLVIDRRVALPLNPYNSYPDDQLEALTNLDDRCDQAFDVAQNRADKQSRQNVLAWGMTIAISGFVFVIIILSLLVASGRVG